MLHIFQLRFMFFSQIVLTPHTHSSRKNGGVMRALKEILHKLSVELLHGEVHRTEFYMRQS